MTEKSKQHFPNIYIHVETITTTVTINSIHLNIVVDLFRQMRSCELPTVGHASLAILKYHTDTSEGIREA